MGEAAAAATAAVMECIGVEDAVTAAAVGVGANDASSIDGVAVAIAVVVVVAAAAAGVSVGVDGGILTVAAESM